MKPATYMLSDDFIMRVCEKIGLPKEGVSKFEIKTNLGEVVTVSVEYSSEKIAMAIIESITDKMKENKKIKIGDAVFELSVPGATDALSKIISEAEKNHPTNPQLQLYEAEKNFMAWLQIAEIKAELVK